ncbi:MAG TPA: hypothetical protein VEO00_13500 [Actinomycetota bacterium]|nr:hypothetical protein [Actinomycetota bacterium]
MASPRQPTAQPSLVHVLEPILLDDGRGTPDRGTLEAGRGFLEFRGARGTLRMAPVADVTRSGDGVVVAYGDTGTSRAVLSDLRRGPERAASRAGPFAALLRDFVGLPPIVPPRRRVAGYLWGLVLIGWFAGYLVGVAFSGGGLGITDFAETVWTGGAGTVAALAIAWSMGRPVRLAAAFRYGFAGATVASGFLIGVAGGEELADEGPDDLGAWLGSRAGIAGLILLGVVLATATATSFLRFPTRAAGSGRASPA